MINHNIKNLEEERELAAHITWFHNPVYGLMQYDLLHAIGSHIHGELDTFCYNEIELRADVTQRHITDAITEAIDFNKYKYNK